MAEFTSAVYQNEFLPDGGTDVNAIVTITCTGAGSAGRTGSGDAGEIIVVDTSGSMGVANMNAAKQAAMIALDNILDGTYFAVVAGNHKAYLAYPMVQTGAGMVRMDARTRAEARRSISFFRAEGGTAMGTWLNLCKALFASIGNLAQKHVILLTDGENHNETPTQLDQAIANCAGDFQVDARGVGVDWKVAEIRKIAQAMLGTVDIIGDPAQMGQVFAELMRKSMARGVANAELRVWIPQGAQVLFIRQVSPTVEDLTHRGTPVNQLTMSYPTGAWADEERDYHVAVRLAAKSVGQEQLAARVQLAVGPDLLTQGLVKAKWSSDTNLTAQINPEVAHYTGQAELAQVIQEGLAAKAVGDEATATTKLGRAVQLATESGNAEATAKLRKVVDIADARTGTVRLRKAVDKVDEMALDTASTKTTRIRG
ncbi:MAG: VWA domain-containing protein [Propionicimonas sp.]|uniref:vWA domain-containing protein n=1 Tax=Propionicimonas sp. TaxID=1955623 RepID=UPI003D10D509